MESVVIDNNLDKECSALGGLFQQIMIEMKNGVPNFEEFIGKAGKLHTSLRSTILVLGSFLDSFQKIADSASNTKGTTRDIGTCLTRIVIRHRALESRMKTLAGALMDCLVLPIQGKLDEWKKVAVILDKEHAKVYKKNRGHIKKKYDQVVRLKKKLKKDKSGAPDASVQRLYDQCSKDLNSYFRSLEKSEKASLRRVLMEDRNRYATFVAFLKPVLEEEIAMFSELNMVEDILGKLSRSASLEQSPDLVIEDFVSTKVSNGSSNGSEDKCSLYLPTPPSTPYMGSRNNSMSSLASDSTATNSSISINLIGSSPSRRSTQSEVDYKDYAPSLPSSAVSQQDLNASPVRIPVERPTSASSWSDVAYPDGRPHTISSSFNKQAVRPSLSGSTFMSTSDSEKNSDSPSLLNQYNSFSTIKRTSHSPFPRPPVNGPLVKRPPLPTQTVNRNQKSEVGLGRFIKKFSDSGPHYATPKSTFNNQLVPNFISNSQDMIIPHPVYMSSKNIEDNLKASSLKQINPGSPQFESSTLEDDLKTPIVEEGHSFNEGQTVVPKEDGSGSSSDSFGSSSGYGSQYTIRIDENTHNKEDGCSNSSPSHSTSFSKSTNNTLYNQGSKDRFLSPCQPGQRTPLANRKPPPPIRRSSIGNTESSQKDSSKDNDSILAFEDDDPTPKGSIENLSPILRNKPKQQELSPITAFNKDGTIRRFYQKGEISNSLDECNYIQSPRLRSNLDTLNSFAVVGSSKTHSSPPSAPMGLPTSIKAEIESALEKLRTRREQEEEEENTDL